MSRLKFRKLLIINDTPHRSRTCNLLIRKLLTSEAIDFMDSSDEPFLTWINYQDPHPAFTCPAPYKDMFNPDEIKLPGSFRNFNKDRQPVRNEVWRKHSQMDKCSDEDMRKAIATYMGQIRYVDDCVGKLMQYLEDKGLAENTVVLFFSDHGELLGDFGMTHKLPVFYDSLTKIPVLIRHPEGNWAGSKFAGLTEEVDLVPTLLKMMDVNKPPTMVGRSWVDVLESGSDEGKISVLCEAGGGAPTVTEPIDEHELKAPQLPTSLGPGAMIRQGDWKLSIYEDDRCELFNLADDPDEMKNLYGYCEYNSIQSDLTLSLMKRLLGVKIRDIGIDWPHEKHPVDVRFEALQKNTRTRPISPALKLSDRRLLLDNLNR